MKKILLFFLLMSLSSCKVGRFFVYNFADINDHKKFPSRDIKKGATKFQFPIAEKGKVPKEIVQYGRPTKKQSSTSPYAESKMISFQFEQLLEESKTVAFLVIKNDTIQYEKYWGKYDESSIVPSFSMAKSILSLIHI